MLVFAVLFDLPRIVYAADSAASHSARTADDPILPDPTDHKFKIILGVIALMAILFVILFAYQQRTERSSFFSRIYRDSIKDHEIARLSVPVREKHQRGIYFAEILLGQSTRGVDWLKANPRPSLDDEKEKNLKALASELGKLRAVRSIEELTSMRDAWEQDPWIQQDGSTRNPFDTGNRFPIGRTSPPGLGFIDLPEEGDDKDRPKLPPEEMRKKKIEYNALVDEFNEEVGLWLRKARGQAWTWYQEELAEVEQTANKQAERALSVDFSALRGRGPEFVLEFTAVVVIIFAAVILGILEALHREQIGTLLAAIAGYVLGKGTNRSRAELPGETKDRDSIERPAQQLAGK